jgi:hypothetical protein
VLADVCKAFCTDGLARGIKDAVKCTFDLPVQSIQAAARMSDAGQQIAYHHGADRRSGRAPTPEDAWLEQYDILVNNDVSNPKINRNCIQHAIEPAYAFVPFSWRPV